MQETLKLPAYVKISHIFMVIIGGYLILDFGSDILITLCVAIFLTFLLLPISIFFENKGLPKWLAIVISITLALLFIILLIGFFTYQLSLFQEDLPALKKTSLLKYKEAQHYIEQHFHFTRREQTLWINRKMAEYTRDASTYMMNALTTTSALIANVSLIPIYIFFLSYYKDKIIAFIYSLVQRKYKRKVYFTIAKVCRVSQQYLKGLLLDIIILSVLNTIGFLLLDLQYAILFGVLAAFLNIVPYIGVLVGSIFPVAIALLTKDSIWYAVGALGVCGIVQFLDNNFITPKVVGSSVSINPLAAMLALLVGAKVWGVIGMILSIPVAGMFKVLFDQIETLKPVGFLLGQETKIFRKGLNGEKELIDMRPRIKMAR